ncbi:type VI secretion system baseplate subunit TssK [Rhizobium jaguaris]|uniref:type VI secretion system baseplate subunit TssK n=1 Tax=Rhizobium jaguaris TaxID=1312183 RepID=UPI0039BF8D0A
MSTGKPLWLEGMFLRPQHLQQYDRWIEDSLEQRVAALLPYSWGLRSLQLDPNALKNGQVRVISVEMIFPDGTVYAAPAAQPLPPARHLTTDFQGKRLFMAAPLRAPGGIDVADNDNPTHRFRRVATELRDSAKADRPPADIYLAALNARLVIEGESLDELVYIPIAEIDAVDAQGQVTLSETFIPPALVAGASVRLVSLMEQIRGLLKSRSDALASGAAGEDGGTRSGTIDLITLGIVNRYQAVFDHMIASAAHTPEIVYRECIALAGELSAFAATGRKLPDLGRYNHRDLRASFENLMPILRNLLSVIVERNALSIPLTERDYGIWLGEIKDRMTFAGRRFVLIARANIALETIRVQMPIQVKIGPVEQIRDLVNLQLPGIGVQPLSVAPREIPFIQNAVYFELDDSNPLWSRFRDSAAFALHVSGEYPGLKLELWAIQKGTAQ